MHTLTHKMLGLSDLELSRRVWMGVGGGWVDGWVDGWMDGWWVDGWVDGWWMGGWV